MGRFSNSNYAFLHNLSFILIGSFMTKDQLIYIGSPYTHSDKIVMNNRYNSVLAITADLLNRGFHVISPIVHCHPLSVKYNLKGDFEFWKKYNFALLSKCDILLVVPLNDWVKSVGLKAEIEFAQDNNIPVEVYNLVH